MSDEIDMTSTDECEHGYQRRFCYKCRGSKVHATRQDDLIKRAQSLCTECGYRLDEVLVREGMRTHPNCDKGLEPPSRPSIDRNTSPVTHAKQATSRAAGRATLPNSGTQRRMVYDLMVTKGELGMCDHEIEKELGFRIPSVCAARNSLMNDGWVYDSGRRRKTPQGHDAIVWVASHE